MIKLRKQLIRLDISSQTRQKGNRKVTLSNKKITIGVEGMKCEHCEAHVEEALQKLPEVKSAKANRKKNIVIITLNSEVDEENLQKTIENCNKKYLGIQN